MKAIFISFNQAYYEMILSIMDRNNIRGFTYWEEVQGRGSKNGEPHYGSHAWPTLNSAILAMVPDEKVDPFLDLLHGFTDRSPGITCIRMEYREINLIRYGNTFCNHIQIEQA